MEITELTVDTWPLLETLFSANKTVGDCWCCWFMRSNAELEANWGEGNKSYLRSKVEESARLGLLAVEDGAPLGWVAAAPHPTYPRLDRSNVTRSGAGPDTWSVTCFFVHRNARRSGLAATLLDAAVDYAGSHGAVAVEACPVDTEGQRRTSDELYHGTLAMFLAAGFDLVERRGTRRALVRRDLP